MDKTLSCVVIGSDTLLIECADTLRTKGLEIQCVVTRSPRIKRWAESKGINTLLIEGALGNVQYAEQLANYQFDYLFSITHLEIIPDQVLQLASQRAINFHDGPLPRYAGLNTPAWAIMHGEPQYGITWHEMVPGVDEGDILKQQLFDVSPDETSISINTKCFAAALDSFPVLVDELLSGTVDAQKQNLEQRSYFGRRQRPAAAGLLRWTESASSLEATVRALNFGEYANPLAAAKLRLGDHLYVVSEAVAQEGQSQAAAGEVLAIDESRIDVACAEGVLSITQLKCLAGNAMAPSVLTAALNVSVGSVLPVVDAGTLEAVVEADAEAYKNEPAMLRLLSTLEPMECPYGRSADGASETADSMLSAYPFVLSDAFKQLAGQLSQALPHTVIAVYALMLARLGRKSQFDLAYSDANLIRRRQSTQDLVSEKTVFRSDIDLEQPANEALVQLAAHSSGLSAKGLWMREMVARYPELQAVPEIKSGGLLPLAVSVSDELVPVKGAMLTLALNEVGDASCLYDAEQVAGDDVQALVEQLNAFAGNVLADVSASVKTLALLSPEAEQQVLIDWNKTALAYDVAACVHHLFEQQVIERPEAIAVAFEDQQITYRELNNRANALAAVLVAQNVAPDDLVGVHVERSIDLLVATLGVMKSGAAYVPLDPAFPAERIAYMVEDAAMKVIVTQTAIREELPSHQASELCVDAVPVDAGDVPPVHTAVTPANLAYVIYTSGSTGKPKGVMVEHRNAVNFFAGMDERIERDRSAAQPGTWLAVTSLSFDISVLELFWTLSRGFKVVVYREDRGAASVVAPQAKRYQQQSMQFGLFMWGNDDAPGSQKYHLLIEGAKYFDQNGFDSVWTPERHFHAFGGPYPNPAVTSAAIAAVTENVHIRSGSIVSPLHHPIRIAEDWAVVDNLSDGRVGLSFAAGWQPNDFVIKPENHKNNKAVMLEQIDTVKKLWRGEKVAFENPMGDMVDITTLPRPVQNELPIWLTTAGNPESYRQAGAKGVNVLTHLLGQSVEEVAEKIRIYREARKEAGLDPAAGQVTLMLHTFVGEDDDSVREIVREPMKDYLRSSMKLVLDFAWSFPAFKRPGGADAKVDDVDIKSLSEEESETILDFAFERYFETSGLFGTVETCIQMVDRCKAAGVDEIACLLDFGVPTEEIMQNLPRLKQVRDQANSGQSLAAGDLSDKDFGVAAQMRRYQVTHFQCTPSMARMLCYDTEAREAMGQLKQMMVGGEAFPTSLAAELKQVIRGRLTNMYGPTETTIWSTTQDVLDAGNIPIGRPIANTQIYIVDDEQNPLPVGIAGHLYIGGDGVVRGYHNRADLTKERFLPNPFVDKADARMYWTGDLARYRRDGVIEFLGRVDHQVKIRGYRIELGEIETQLGQHAAVSECVLLLREDTPGDQRLVAYVVADGLPPDTAVLKAHLRERLPDYMVPTDFVMLDAMPLTPNGKIDRKQLPSPQGASAKASVAYVAPEDDLQKIIVSVWQGALQVDKIGVNDNFFDLGGHSLLIVRVHQELKTKLEKPISLTDLYRFPTVGALSEFLNSDDKGASLQQSTDRAQRRRERMGLRRRKK
ncbi:LLM class flavin-dependent oxidoreductase [bacterium]|nr:LLM class flavin-dependent oxidoreductase [bacterium]